MRVAYTHCTVGNHVYYSRYLDLLEVARGEFSRHLGHPLQRLQDENLIFPVVECSIRYRGAARYDDELSIEVWVKEFDRIRIRFAHKIKRGEEVLVEAETLHVCTNLQDKPSRIPTVLAEALRPYSWQTGP